MPISISLPEDLLRAIDERRRAHTTRSEFIETVLRSFLSQIDRREQEARDRKILDQHADELNEEAADVLAYQIPL